MRHVTILCSLVLALGLAACGPGTSPDAATEAGPDVADVTPPPPDTSPMDAASDAASDAALDVARDTMSDDATSPDATSPDGETDAGRVAFTASIHVDLISQNCMPVVAPDPLRFSGSLEVVNTGTLPIGPVTTSDTAVVVAADHRELARFAITPATLPAITLGGSASAAVAKRDNTLTPANGCMAVPCGTLARVRVAISGPNVPPGAMANSPLSTVTCAF